MKCSVREDGKCRGRTAIGAGTYLTKHACVVHGTRFAPLLPPRSGDRVVGVLGSPWLGVLRRVGKRRWGHTLAWGLVTVQVVYMTMPVIFHMTSGVIGDGGDTPQNLWDIAWVRGWLTGSHGLYYTHQLLAPTGANLAWMTLDVPINVVAALLSLGLGLTTSYNVVLLLSQLLNGGMFYHFARKVGLGWFGGVMGAAAFLGSAHLIAEMLGHLHELQAFLLLWFCTVFWGTLESERPRKRAFVLLGVIWALTFYAIEDYALYEIAAAVVIAGTHPAVWRRGLLSLASQLGNWGVSAFVGLASSAPLWISLLWGPMAAGLSTAAQTVSTPYVVDLAGLVVPPPWGPFAWEMANWHLSVDPVQAAFPGFLVLAAVVVALCGRLPGLGRDRDVLRVGLIGFAVFAILELGPYLRVGGTATPIPLPYLVLAHLPGWSVTLPVRLSLLTAVFGSLVVAAVGDRIAAASSLQAWGYIRRATIVASGIVLVALSGSWIPFPETPIPTIVAAAQIRSSSGVVLYLPAVVQNSNMGSGSAVYMYWEAVLGLPTVEGYVSRIPAATIARINDTPLLHYFWGWQFTPNPYAGVRSAVERQLAGYLRRNHIRAIVVLRAEVQDSGRRTRWLATLLGDGWAAHVGSSAIVFVRRPV